MHNAYPLLVEEAHRLPVGRLLCFDLSELTLSQSDSTLLHTSMLTDGWLSAERANNIQAVLMAMPKAKDLLKMQLAMLAESLPIDTPLWLFGSKDLGIKSADKLFDTTYWHPPLKLAYGHHAQIWHSSIKAMRPQQGLAAWQQSFASKGITLMSYPSVFSHGHVDEGTALLLQHLPSQLPPNARFLDYGCGAGIIAAQLKQRFTDLTAEGLDINALALEATKATFATNNLGEIKLYHSDSLKAVKAGYNLIISNPPFHTGKAVSLDAAHALIRDAKTKLAPKGELRLVANRFLAYDKVMQDVFNNCTIIAETKKFWILSAINLSSG